MCIYQNQCVQTDALTDRCTHKAETETKTVVRWLPEGRVGEQWTVKGVKHTVMGMEDDVTLGGGHTMQCTDNVSWIHILETYIILLTNVTLTNLIKCEKLK